MNKIKVEPKHKIVEKATMADGTHIQIEDWHPCYDFEPTCGTLAAYPIAKETDATQKWAILNAGAHFALNYGLRPKNRQDKHLLTY